MAKIQPPSYTSFSKGIVDISQAGDLNKLSLPELFPVLPSESKLDTQLPKLYHASSLQNLLMEALTPRINDRDNLSPSIYQKRLAEAKSKFQELAEEARRKRRQRGGQGGSQQSPEEELFEQVVEDFEENEENLDLLWLLRQVVHLA